MKKKILSLLLTLALLLSLLTACGGASKEYAAMDQAAPEAMEEGVAVNGSITSSGSGGTTVLPENRRKNRHPV